MPELLFDRLESTGRLPTPPEVVLRLLDLTRRDDASMRDIADTLTHDSVLVAKIMRFVNSPMAGVACEITSLRRAVAMVGVNGVKMMALAFAVLTSKGAEACRGFDRRQFGVQSVACGVAAKILASEAGDGFTQDAFLAGLLSQIGRSVLAIGIPETYANVLDAAHQVPRDLPRLEREALGETYPEIGAQLLRSWHIPDTLCDAVEKFRELDHGEEAPTLAKVLHVGEVAAGIICPDTKGDLPDSQAFVDAANELMGIERERCADLVDEIAKEVENVCSLLELPKGKMRSPADIEHEVRERVAELTLTISLENQRMAERQEDLIQRAITDALTGVGNRAAFDARMSLELQRSARSGAPFALLMMDVDNFKAFNDAYGHQAGDRALQTVARVLDANIRRIDYLARYGGEEFVVIAPDTSANGVLVLAERLRRAVEETSDPQEGKKLNITLSIGAAVFTEVGGDADASNIIKAADARLYAAKRAGRNRVDMVVDGAPTARLRIGT